LNIICISSVLSKQFSFFITRYFDTFGDPIVLLGSMIDVYYRETCFTLPTTQIYVHDWF
jgi:hypothetical protein